MADRKVLVKRVVDSREWLPGIRGAYRANAPSTQLGYRTPWRLWADGQVQRTSSRSRWQAPYRGERPPTIIEHTADDLGLKLWGFREQGEPHTSETAPGGQGDEA